MRVSRVIGSVTLSRVHPSLAGGSLRLVVPLTAEQITDGPGDREALVAYDQLGAGNGSLAALAEGAEASAPFHPASKPVDAYLTALLDDLELFDAS